MCAVLPAIATGLGLFQGLAMRSAAQQKAEQTYETESTNMRGAEKARDLKVTIAGQNLKAKEAEAAMQRQAADLKTKRQVGTLEASGISGNLLSTLTREAESEGASLGFNLDRSNKALRRNLGLETKAFDAELGRRRSASQSNINQAYNEIPSLSQIALGAGSKALTYNWAEGTL